MRSIPLFLCTFQSNGIAEFCADYTKDEVFHFTFIDITLFCVHDRITNGGIELFVFSLYLLVFQNPNNMNLPPTYTLVRLRLIGGNWSGEGRVEIYYRGSWGTVCDDNWGIKDAGVVCRQLGYSSTAVSAPQSARFGQGSGKIWLDDVQCQGNETSIVNCRHRPWGVHNCGHNEDASVICSSKLNNK